MDCLEPASLGFDPNRLQRIDALLAERYVASGRLPHAQILIAREGRPVHFSTFGQANEAGDALGPDAIFRIASMTKPITSIAYMMLLEEGLTALDDPVASVVRELGDLRVYAGGGGDQPFVAGRPARPVRMIDLLRHTAGFTYGLQNRTSVDAVYRAHQLDEYRMAGDDDAFLAALRGLPLEFEPGSAWNYSVATDVLGIVVARLSGLALADFFRTRIFEPLGMVDTGFELPEDQRHRLTDAWKLQPSGEIVVADRSAGSPYCQRPRFCSGGGGLLSTTADYHRFCSMLVNGGERDGARLISPKTLALMTSNHVPGNKSLAELSRSMFSEVTNAGSGFGLGFAVTIDPTLSLVPGSAGEYYWGGVWSTAFFVDPVERLHMVFMTQLRPSGTYPLRRELKTLAYAALTHSYA